MCIRDRHNAEFGESNTELIELLSEHEPDIIVITGDLIDAGPVSYTHLDVYKRQAHGSATASQSHHRHSRAYGPGQRPGL